jgi:hypothetical protein
MDDKQYRSTLPQVHKIKLPFPIQEKAVFVIENIFLMATVKTFNYPPRI